MSQGRTARLTVRPMANHWKFPDLGFGLGLRSEHFDHVTRYWPRVDWFEVISENYIDTEGRPRAFLDRVREHYPIVLHGVSLSIGSTDPLNLEFIRKLRDLADRIETPWLGDHVCWTGVAGKNGHDLYPIPYNAESLAHLVDRIQRVQDVLGRPLVLENPSTYVTFRSSTMHEADFLGEMAERADCALLLDVNNIYVTCRNHDLDAHDYLRRVPLDRVVQVHLAGHTDRGTHCIDTHDHTVIDPVWDLYAEVQRRAGPIATLLEWDDHIPDFPVVFAELEKARAFRRSACGV